MRILLEAFYRGLGTDFRPIAPGVYDLSDERLYGAGGYLVERGFARLLEDDEEAPKPRRKQAPPTPKE